MEANVWYVKAADQGDERAIQRIAAIQAAAEGANPKLAAAGALGMKKQKGGFLPFAMIESYETTLTQGYQMGKNDSAFSNLST